MIAGTRWWGLAVGALALGIAACGTSTPAAAPAAPSGAGGPQQPAANTPPPVNRVVMALNPPRVESNAMRLLTQTDFWQLRSTYEYLTGVDAQNGRVVPQLASGWVIDPDGTTVRFKLQSGVNFHNGMGAVKAGDIIYSMKEVLKLDTPGGTSPYFKDLFKDMQAPSDSEFVLTFKRPDANLLINVGMQGGGVEVRSEKDGLAKGDASMQGTPTVGTGPYQYDSRQQASNIRFKQAPGKHWRATPDFPEFEFRFVKEASTRLAALLANEVHLVTLPNDLLPQAEKQGYKLLRSRAAGLRTFLEFLCCFFNEARNPASGRAHAESPLWDVKVRQALSKAIDRNALNKAFFGGKGEMMYLNHFHPTRLGWDPNWEKRFPDEYGYDPARAKQILVESGYGPNNPLKANVLVQGLVQFNGAEDLAEAAAAAWRAIGVDVTLQVMDSAALVALRNQQKFESQIEVVGTASDLYTGTQIYASMSGNRTRGIEDPEVYSRLEAPYSTLDDKKAEPGWRALGEAIFTRHSDIPLFWLPVEVVVNPKIVADYVFPGSLSDVWTHIENVKAAR